MQLIVLGMHRSGTSVLARLLNLMGAYFGPEGISTGANQENPKGFWERRDVRMLNDSVLHAVGCDWNRVHDFDAMALPGQVVDDFNKRASRLVLELDAHRPWLLKEPRLCLLLPLWRRFLEVPIGIHVYRNPVEVASSLLKRNGIPMQAGLALWERYVRSAIDGSTGMPRIVVAHRQLVEQPETAVSQLLDALSREGVPGLRMPSEREIAAFIQDDLYRERETDEGLRVYDKAPQVALFRALEAGRLPATTTRKSTFDPRALADYEAGLAPFEQISDEQTSPEAKMIEACEAILRSQLALHEEEIKLVRELSSKHEADLKRRDEWLETIERNHQAARDASSLLEAELLQRSERVAAVEKELQQAREQIDGLGGEVNGLHSQLQAKGTALQELREMYRNREKENAVTGAAKLRAERTLETCYRDVVKLSQIVIGREQELATVATQLEWQRQACVQIENELAGIRQHLLWRLARRARSVAARLGLSRRPQAPLSRDAALLRQSGMFDTKWYLDQYPDVAESGIDPIEHFLQFGAGELRNPSAEFDTASYLEHNTTVSSSGLNPLMHYIIHGKSQGMGPK